MSETRNGGEAAVRVLLDSGVTVMFANPGTTEMGVVEALDTVPGMRAVLGLHENVVTGAADGYGRMTGTAAATLLHLGVGLTNGLANLHNARRAGTPVVNIVGEMATWHRAADPLLGMDIEGLAASVSSAVHTPATSDDVADDTARCVAASQIFKAGGSRIATLVLPHDCTREAAGPLRISLPHTDSSSDIVAMTPFEASLSVDEAMHDTYMASLVERAVSTLQSDGAGTCFFVGGSGLWDGSIQNAGRICAATGASLFCENAFSRVDRGAGTPPITRLAYFPADAKKELGKFRSIIFLGARIPVAMFGYEDGISQVVDEAQQKVLNIDTHDVHGALQYFVRMLKAGNATWDEPAKGPKAPKGKLTAPKLCQCIAYAQPEDAIIVDESLTSGGSYWQSSQGCKRFSQLTLTGGAIGQGPPLSVGVAVACPSRRVINFQADGSGLYTTQALWTQAREKLNVTTVICNNSVYQILKIEQQKQNLSQTGSAAKSLTNLGNPPIDWVSLGKGYGVESVRATTCEELLRHFEKALSHEGPYLIEARL